MPEYVRIQTVWHVGTLELSDRTRQESLEGNLLSVSQHPEEWGMIARCGGDTWELNRDDALWLDALALNNAELAAVAAWAEDQGYAKTANIWRVWRFDDETESWGYLEFTDRAAAEREIEGDDPDAWGEIPSESGELVDKHAGLVLTPAGKDAVGRWHGETNAMDALIIIWADRVLKPDNPDLMGIWWYEDDNLLSLSWPRGGAFTDRLHAFSIENQDGAPAPESFQKCHIKPDRGPEP